MNSFTTIHSNLLSKNQKVQHFTTVSSFTTNISGTTPSQTEWGGFNGTGQYVVLFAYNTPPSTTSYYRLCYLWVSSDYGATFVIKTVNSSQSYGYYGNRQATVNRYGFVAFAVNQNNGGGGIYLSSDAGNNFTQNSVIGDITSRMQGSSINNTNVTSSIVCYAGCNTIGIYKRAFTNFPDTNTFNPVYSTGNSVGTFRFASDLITQNVIYNNGGNVYSTNGGSSWNPISSTSPIYPVNTSYPANDFYISPKETMFFGAGYFYYYLSTTSFTSGWTNISSRFTGLSTYQNLNGGLTPFACTGDNKYIAIAQWFPVATGGIYNNTVQCFISSDFGTNFTAIKVFDASSDPALGTITMTYDNNNTPKRILITGYNITNIYYINF